MGANHILSWHKYYGVGNRNQDLNSTKIVVPTCIVLN